MLVSIMPRTWRRLAAYVVTGLVAGARVGLGPGATSQRCSGSRQPGAAAVAMGALAAERARRWLPRRDPYALACLLALNGLRVGEVCAADVVDLAQDRWHHTLTILDKGDKPAVVPLPPRTVDAVRSSIEDRQAGPRTMIHYDRARHSLDPHASYTVMQYVSEAS